MKRCEQINDAIETYINDLFEDRVEITDEDHENITDAFLSGIEFADSHPKSTWISVESDLPCNHDEFIDKEKNMTKRVLVLGKDVKSNTISNIMSMFFIENHWQWTCEIYFKVTHWMPIPNLPKY